MTVQAFTMEGFGRPRRRVGVRGPRRRFEGCSCDDGGAYGDSMGILPKGSSCRETFIAPSGRERCATYRRPKDWQALYRRADHARVGWKRLRTFDKPMDKAEVRAAIRQRKAAGWTYRGLGEETRSRSTTVPRWPLEGVPSRRTTGGKKMARKRRPANKGKKCVRFKRTKAGRRCAKFGGTSSSLGKAAKKGPCKKWAKKKTRGKRRCLKRG